MLHLVHLFTHLSYSILCSFMSQEDDSSDSPSQISFLIGLVNWRWRTEHRVFLPHALLVCLIYSHGCLLSTRSFCQVASAPKIPTLSGLQHLISSPCPFKTWVVSLPLFPVSGCPNTRVYFPVTTGTMIHSVAGTIPVRFCVLPGSW